MVSKTTRTREEICLAIAARMSEDDATITEARRQIPLIEAKIRQVSDEIAQVDGELHRLRVAAPRRIPQRGRQLEAVGRTLTGVVVSELRVIELEARKGVLIAELEKWRTELVELERRLEMALGNHQRMANEFRENRCGEIISPALAFRPL